jgi:hypothetical protein
MPELSYTKTYHVPDFGIHLSINELEQMMSRAGSHFFDASARRFFRSRIAPSVWAVADGWLFITSEQFETHYPSFRRDARKYTIRKVVIQHDDLTIIEPEGHELGFQKYASLAQAKRAVQQMIKGTTKG